LSRNHINTSLRVPIILLDSITEIKPTDSGSIIVSASHGGSSSGKFAVKVNSSVVFFNDAGVGRDAAGIAALEFLQVNNLAAGTIGFMSARIGNSTDSWENGIISYLNNSAKKIGFLEGLPLKEQAIRLYGKEDRNS
jgi:hypothetical protein